MTKGQGGMVAVLGSSVDVIENILTENKENLKVQIANDNTEGQIVLSGKTEDLKKLIKILKDNSVKNIKLPVSAPFLFDFRVIFFLFLLILLC